MGVGVSSYEHELYIDVGRSVICHGTPKSVAASDKCAQRQHDATRSDACDYYLDVGGPSCDHETYTAVSNEMQARESQTSLYMSCIVGLAYGQSQHAGKATVRATPYAFVSCSAR